MLKIFRNHYLYLYQSNEKSSKLIEFLHTYSGFVFFHIKEIFKFITDNTIITNSFLFGNFLITG